MKFDILLDANSSLSPHWLRALLFLTGLLMSWLPGTAQSLTHSGTLVDSSKAAIGMSNGARVRLTQNPSAQDPSLDTLIRFLETDPTDQVLYVKGQFVCVEFALVVHNNAEKAGIRAAFVTIEYSDGGIGHALNAFKTTDHGLVYVDCTNSGKPGDRGDRFSYLRVGKPCGQLSLALGRKAPSDYAHYESMKLAFRRAHQWNVRIREDQAAIASMRKRLQAATAQPNSHNQQDLREAYVVFNQKVAAYNGEIARLSSLRDALGTEFFSANESPVKSVEIWW
jgi:hypothetical protein